MRILFVNTTLRTGGASIACQRLRDALVAEGHEVRLLMRDDSRMINRVRFCWERICFLWQLPYRRVFSLDDGRCGTDITQTPEFEWAEVVHLHWVNQAMLGLKDLEVLFRSCRENGKRLVWTLHDIWPATGVCHLPGSCQQWQTGCGNCPQLRHAGPKDWSARTYQRKAAIYAAGEAQFVTCSRFLGEMVKKSQLMESQSVSVIPNPLDTDFFSPLSFQDATAKATLRQKLGLPTDKCLVLFVSYNINDENKGFAFVCEAVQHLVRQDARLRDALAVVPVGKNASVWVERFPCMVCPQEYVSSRETMRDLYRASDLLVCASKMDNFPNTIAEAKACGLPVVGTRVGGVPEMINDGEDGVLVTAENAEDIARGLNAIVNAEDYDALSAAARSNAIKQFAPRHVVARYEALYRGKQVPS